MNKHPVASLKPTSHHHVAVDRKESLRQRGCGHSIKALGPGQSVAPRDSDVLSISTTGAEGCELFADKVARNPFANVQNGSCRFQSGQIARTRRRVISPRALQDVRTINAGGLHFEEDLTSARFRNRTRRRHQYIRATRFADFNDCMLSHIFQIPSSCVKLEISRHRVC